MLMVMSRGYMRVFTFPIFGCSPRPLNSPGGSTLKLPTCENVHQQNQLGMFQTHILRMMSDLSCYTKQRGVPVTHVSMLHHSKRVATP